MSQFNISIFQPRDIMETYLNEDSNTMIRTHKFHLPDAKFANAVDNASYYAQHLTKTKYLYGLPIMVTTIEVDDLTLTKFKEYITECYNQSIKVSPVIFFLHCVTEWYRLLFFRK